MWHYQQKEENSTDIKDRARLIYISLTPPSPQRRASSEQKDKGMGQKIKTGEQETPRLQL